MTIRELIFDDKINDVRISHENKWLVGHEGILVVYEQNRYQKGPAMLYEGSDEEMAVSIFIGERG